MTALGRIRATLLTIAIAVAGLPAAAPAQAQGTSYLRLSAADIAENRPVYLGVNKSVVIDLPRAAGDVLVSNPQIADAVLRTSTRLYLIGVKLGQANVFLFDGTGAQMASFDVYVEADLGGLNQLLAEAIPNGYVRAEAVNGSIVLRGQVASSTDSGKAEQITASMIAASPTSITSGTASGTAAGTTSTSSTQTYDPNSGPQIINLLTITGEEQVALKVTIAEVQREVIKQLGVNMKGFLDSGNWAFGTNVTGPLGDVTSGVGLSPLTFPFNTATTPGSWGVGWSNGTDSVQATVEALEETHMLKTLAEPTLTAVSGETADFLAGGEFPVPVTGDNGQIDIQFKQFGVNLAFTPVVLAAGRISLKMRTEVSDLSATGAVSVPLTSTSTVTIPAISVRRAETTVELPSGGAFAVAGLIQDSMRRAVSGYPWLQNIPVLGALFSSKDFQNQQTELMIIVTPYLVKPTSPKALARPDDNLVMSSDAQAYFLNRLTKVYGTASSVPAAAAGQVGFTFD
jgi:pilus assembly protein CpaC